MKIKNPLNEVLIRRRKTIFIRKGSSERKSKEIVALNIEIAQLGYTLSKKLMDRLKTLSKKDFNYERISLIRFLEKYSESRHKYTTLFKDFPKETPTEEDMLSKLREMYVNVFHENSWEAFPCGHTVYKKEKFNGCPVCGELFEKETKKSYKEKTPLTIIDLEENKDEVYSILKNLLSSNVPLGYKDYEDIKIIIKNGSNKKIIKYIPEQIKIKEIFAKMFSLLMNKENLYKEFIKDVKLTMTDILRIIAELGESPESELGYFRVKSFKNKERKLLLELIEKTENKEVEMKKYREKWKRVGEVLHPCAYKNKYPRTCKAFSVIRNQRRIVTFNTNIEDLLEKEEYIRVINLLKSRPGEFGRRIDFLLRKEPKVTIRTLNEVIKDITTKNLFVLEAFLNSRTEKKEFRYFIPKGSFAKIKYIEETLPKLNKKYVKEISKIIEGELLKRLKKEKVGKVYLGKELNKITIPKTLKNLSEGDIIYPRGSKIPFEKGKILRPFLYWKASVDLDLSVVILNEEFEVIERCAYTDLNSKNMKHSGDIRSAPEGGAEFVDIDLKNIKGRYIILSVISYTSEPFSDIDCFIGYMNREKALLGEVFEPRSVQNKFYLKGEGTSAVPVIFDLKTNEVIISDIFYQRGRGLNTYSAKKDFEELIKILEDMNKSYPKQKRLFELYVKANEGEIVKNIEESEISFGFNGKIKPHELDKIVSDFLE